MFILMTASLKSYAAEPGQGPQLQAYFQAGLQSLQNNDMNGAVNAVMKIKQIDANDIRGYFLAIQVLWKMQKLPDLIWEIERAEKSGIHNPDLYKQKILALFLVDGFMATYDALDGLEKTLRDEQEQKL